MQNNNITVLKTQNLIITDPKQLENEFNNFFTAVGANL